MFAARGGVLPRWPQPQQPQPQQSQPQPQPQPVLSVLSVLCACVLLCLCAFVLPVSMASITNATNATNTAVTLCSVLLVCSLYYCAPCKHDQHGPLCRKIWGPRQLLGTPGPVLSEDLGAPGSYRGPSRTLGAEPVQHLVQYCSPCQAFTCQLLRRFLHRISTS